MGGALEKAMENQVFVGIDVSKARLDAALRPGAGFSVTNNQRGTATLVKRLKKLGDEPHRARGQRRLRNRGGG
jgi:hypothetical protein